MIDRVRRLVHSGLELDSGQMLIYEFLKGWMCSNYSTKKIVNGQVLVLVDRVDIISYIPEFDYRTSIYPTSKLKSLETRGVIDVFQQGGQKWVGFTNIYDKIEGFEEIEMQKTVKKVRKKLTFIERKEIFKEKMLAFKANNPNLYKDAMYKKFYGTWTAPMQNDENVMYFETKPTFVISQRLANWASKAWNTESGEGSNVVDMSK